MTSKFTTLYEDKDAVLIMEEAPYFMDGVFMHTTIKHFSKSLYKNYHNIWNDVVDVLKFNGVNNIYALPTDEMAEKWETKFGFVDTGVTFEGQKIMKWVNKNG